MVASRGKRTVHVVTTYDDGEYRVWGVFAKESKAKEAYDQLLVVADERNHSTGLGFGCEHSVELTTHEVE